MENVIVRDSPIHGRGVFAVRRLEPGDVIIDGCRDVLTDEAAAALPPDERVYVSNIDGQHILMQPPSRFVNHSCDPNARSTDRQDIAIRVIEPGEEVTVDYVAEQVPGLRMQCNCRAANCRGWIVI